MALQETWGRAVPHTVDDGAEHPCPGRVLVATYLRRGIFADAMHNLMTQEHFEVATADDGESLVELGMSADGCIVDLAMDDAVDALVAVSQECDHLRVVALADARTKRAAVRVSRLAYVTSDDSLERVLAFLRGEAVHFGSRSRAARARSRHHANGRDPRRLTTRESEILEGLLDGENTKVLAARLGVSQATARTHVQSVLSKLGVHSRLEAVALVNRELSGSAIDLFDPASRRSTGQRTPPVRD